MGPDGLITRMLAAGRIPSIILWGPPGTGKTTIARLLAGETGLAFEQISAIFSGVADLKKVFEQARIRREQGRGTLLFVTRSTASTSPSRIPSCPMSRMAPSSSSARRPKTRPSSSTARCCRAPQVLVLNRLGAEALEALIRRAELFERRPLPADPAAREAMIAMADGDGRYFLNMLEEVFAAVPEGGTALTPEALARTVQKRMPLYDKAADGHYNLISALHKSVRGSDPDAALYYLARMLVAGEDPLFLARRILRMAIEDVGLADPEAVHQALAAKEAFDFLAARRANWRWRRQSSMSPPRPSRTRSIPPSRPQPTAPGRPVRSCHPRSSSTRRRS